MYIGRSVMLVLCVVVSASTAGAFGSRDRISRSRDRSGWHRPGSRDRSSSSSSTSRSDRTSRRDAPTRQPDPGKSTRSSTSPTPKPTPAPPAGNSFGGSLPGLTTEERARFDAGRDAFEEVETAADGLGPVFNDTSCVACHDGGATGGGSETIETRFGMMVRRDFDPLAAKGGSLIQTDGIGKAGDCNFVGEVVPRQATVVAGRRATPLFGLGLVDAVPDATFIALAQKQARRQPETAGRPSMVTDLATGATVVGKFGWKGQVPNLNQFSADAYLNEMGITTPMFPEESCPQGNCALLACDPVPGVDDDMEDVELFRDFMTFLAAPPRPRLTSGSRVFDKIGCATCHVRSFTTARNDIVALSVRKLQPFSDFLLHDMGDLGDGIEQGSASGREMRTAPLWGLRLVTTFLHDGRAKSVEEAILAHDGQGRFARDRFRGLSADAKAKLLAFVGSL